MEKPFTEVLIHVGNPQGMGQPPITFFRQVKSSLKEKLVKEKIILTNEWSFHICQYFSEMADNAY